MLKKSNKPRIKLAIFTSLQVKAMFPASPPDLDEHSTTLHRSVLYVPASNEAYELHSKFQNNRLLPHDCDLGFYVINEKFSPDEPIQMRSVFAAPDRQFTELHPVLSRRIVGFINRTIQGHQNGPYCCINFFNEILWGADKATDVLNLDNYELTPNTSEFQVNDGLWITNIDRNLIGHFAICIGNNLFLSCYGDSRMLGISTLGELLNLYQGLLKKQLVTIKLKPGAWNPDAYFNLPSSNTTQETSLVTCLFERFNTYLPSFNQQNVASALVVASAVGGAMYLASRRPRL